MRRVVLLLQRLVARVLLLVKRRLLVRDGPVRREAQARDAAEELAVLQPVRFEKSRRLRVVAQVRGKRTVRAILHQRAGATALLRQLQRLRVAEVGELRAAQHRDGRRNGLLRRGRSGRGALQRQRDAIDSVGLAGFLGPARHVVLRHERRPGAVQQEVALGERGLERLRPLHQPQPREAREEHFLDAVVNLARPQPHLDAGQVLLDERQHTRRVRDVADVHRLPRRAQQQARGPLVRGAHGGGESGSERSGKKVTAIHQGSPTSAEGRLAGWSPSCCGDRPGSPPGPR